MAMTILAGKTAVVTGATSGIGRAIVLRLAAEGVKIIGVSRAKERLNLLQSEIEHGATVFRGYEADFFSSSDAEQVAGKLRDENKEIDILVHSAGYFKNGEIETTSVDELDRHFAVNVRSPYILTQYLLPVLRSLKGQIVFVNSSVCFQPGKPGLSNYVASKFALKGIADCLREEVNSQGVRVTSVYPGRTATAMQAEIYAKADKTYNPEVLLQPEEVADLIIYSLKLPGTAEVTDLSVRPLKKS